MADETLPNGFTPEGNAALLAHPLPNLEYAVYVPARSADLPVAIFEDFHNALDWSMETYGQSAEVRKIKTHSDRMPVARPRWRDDT